MSVTKKFIVFIFIGIPLLIVSYFINIYYVVFALYNLVLAVLLLIDNAISAKNKDFVITRGSLEKLSQNAENEIEIFVNNKSAYPYKAEIKDEIPDWHFTVLNEDIKKVLIPKGITRFSYFVTPSKRGSFAFGRIHLKCTGKLGLVTKCFAYHASFEYKVYPNLQNLKKYRLIIQKNRLLSHGSKTVKIHGQGMEFESLREYVPGDDYRKVNWMATARENKIIINQFEAEKNQPVMLLIDTGRPMSYSVKGYKKLDYAVNTALILSDIVNQKGDLSGLLVFDTDIQRMIMPGKGMAHRNMLMEALYTISDHKNTSDYEGAFYHLASKQKRRSVIFIFTDFSTIDEANDMIKYMPLLSRKHLIVIMMIKNHSLENISVMSTKDADNIFLSSAAMEYLNERKKIINALLSKGIMCIESDAENVSLDAINRYLLIKNKNML